MANNPYERKANNTTNYVHPNESNLWEVHKAMDYDPYGAPVLRIDDTTKQHTSKNRVKTSAQYITFYNTFQFSKDPQVWDEQTTGTASSTYEPDESLVRLDVGSNAGDEIVRQTRKVMRYVPGRQIEFSGAFRAGAPMPGIRRRAGLFDDFNGVYLEGYGDLFYAVVRSTRSGTTSELKVERADWNIDSFDGTGPSGIVVDATMMQVMVIEYEWYGSGTVEFKFIYKNNAYPCHRFDFSNISDRTWSATAFFPIRIELTNVTGEAGPATFFQGSNAVMSEGALEKIGVEENAASPITGRLLPSANTFYPVLSIRLKPDRLNGVVLPIEFQAATLDNTAIFYRIYRTPELTGANWQSVADASFCEFDASATALTGGEELRTGYINSTNQGLKYRFADESSTQIERNNMGTTSEIVTIAVACTQANKAAFASINWIEMR